MANLDLILTLTAGLTVALVFGFLAPRFQPPSIVGSLHCRTSDRPLHPWLHRDLQSQVGRIAVGWLIVEDIFTVVALVVLPTVFGARAEDSLPVALLRTAVKLVALTGLTLGAGDGNANRRSGPNSRRGGSRDGDDRIYAEAARATPEQMDTERRHIRRELYDLPPKRVAQTSN